VFSQPPDGPRGRRERTPMRFERPHLVAFRLVRGPVPEVTGTFSLSGEGGFTALRYEGGSARH
jgi:hypothetical protein